MAPPGKDYYRILGVEEDESQEGIRRAFRRLAKERHPDKRGPESTRAFQEIVEAYETLSDPERRRAYDRERAGWSRGGGLRAWEPDAWGAVFAGPRAPAVLELELRLRTWEAAWGTAVTLGIPRLAPCPACGGRGEDGPFFFCLECLGSGEVEAVERFEVRVPPRTRAGSVLELPLPGRPRIWLRLHVRVVP